MKTWLDLASLDDRLATMGPTRNFLLDGSPLEHELEAMVFIDRGFLADHPGSEDALIRAGHGLDYPPAVVFENAPPALVELPDELFLREFLAIDADDEASVVGFIADWGPLIEVYTAVQSDVVQLVPSAWQQYSVDEYTRVFGCPTTDPADERDRQELASNGLDRDEMLAELVTRRAARDAARLGDVAQEASLNPLDAVLDQPWRLMTELRIELFKTERDETTADEREDRMYELLGSPRRFVSLRSYSLSHQMWLVRLYQAVFESWVRLDPDRDLTPRRLGTTPKKALVEPWARRNLPTPKTTFEAVVTVQSLVNEATATSGPRIELSHPALELLGGAYGRPVPRILAAMCLQLLSWVAEGVPARQCASETCGNWFSRQRGRAGYGQYRTAGVLYCSSSCAKAQAQREYRRRQRTDHPS